MENQKFSKALLPKTIIIFIIICIFFFKYSMGQDLDYSDTTLSYTYEEAIEIIFSDIDDNTVPFQILMIKTQ